MWAVRAHTAIKPTGRRGRHNFWLARPLRTQSAWDTWGGAETELQFFCSAPWYICACASALLEACLGYPPGRAGHTEWPHTYRYLYTHTYLSSKLPETRKTPVANISAKRIILMFSYIRNPQVTVSQSVWNLGNV